MKTKFSNISTFQIRFPDITLIFLLISKGFTEDYQVEILYDELCVKGNVVEVVTESGKISREAVLDRMDYP